MAGSPTDGAAAGAGSRDAAAPAQGIVTRRTVEIATAIVTALFGALVAADSLPRDIGWNVTGPGSGYFPFRIGLLLVTAAGLVIAEHWRRVGGAAAFVTRPEMRRTLSVLGPTALLACAMLVLGCYVPSGVYLAWMLHRHGGRSWPLSLGYGLAVALAIFVVFDVWFGVPLAKGPLEAALGLA